MLLLSKSWVCFHVSSSACWNDVLQLGLLGHEKPFTVSKHLMGRPYWSKFSGTELGSPVAERSIFISILRHCNNDVRRLYPTALK
jgi:hypothetical protein